MSTLQAKFGRVRHAFDRGDFETASRLLREMMAAGAHGPQIYYLLSTSEGELGRLSEAERFTREGLRRYPAHHGLWTRLARVHQARGRIDPAHEAIDRAIDCSPGESRPVSVKAELLLFEGRLDDAAAVLEEAFDRCSPAFPLAIVYARVCMATGSVDDALDRLLPHAEDASISAMARRTLLFRLGDLLDRAGRYEEAFDAYQEANALRHSGFDRNDFERSVDLLIESWPAHAASSSSDRSDRPIFIVGMPRSGTSLLEQMLDRHPSIHGAGELPLIRSMAQHLGLSRVSPFHHVHDVDGLTMSLLDDLAATYLTRAVAPEIETDHFTDKDPLNLEHLGLVASMFPGCRVIHCLRDPVDTCLSCYFQDFSGIVPWAGDLSDVAAACRAYRRLADHWHTSLAVPILDVRYEELVADPAAQIARVLSFLDLPYEESCTAPHESNRLTITASNQQVRRPIHGGSVRRHERYGSRIEPLRRALRGVVDSA